MEKLLVTSDFSFSLNVCHSYIALVHQNVVLCGNGLNFSAFVFDPDFRLFLGFCLMLICSICNSHFSCFAINMGVKLTYFNVTFFIFCLYSVYFLFSVYFMLSTLFGRSFIKMQYSSFLLFPVAYPSRIAMH